jgi:protein tyrosine phosphatase (PTP) superfamily phosphohydrolase (DUF442 family)
MRTGTLRWKWAGWPGGDAATMLCARKCNSESCDAAFGVNLPCQAESREIKSSLRGWLPSFPTPAADQSSACKRRWIIGILWRRPTTLHMNQVTAQVVRCAAFCALVAASSGSTGAGESPPNTPTNRTAWARIEIPGIHNSFRVTDTIYSGSQPEGDAAFAALAKLGVKTIVSVDGSKPDVERAHKYGLQYVHLPFGYDGVPTNRVVELAKLRALARGPFFVHCHHGLHRGPTAVAVICEASAGWTPDQAEAWLRQAGTADDYQGLYRAAREFKAPTAVQLAAVGSLPEVAPTPSLVDAMVAMDEHFDWLKKSQKAGWKTPRGQADIAPAHEATMLWEQLREMARTPDTAKRPDDYRQKLAAAESVAADFRTRLAKPADAPALDAAFKQFTQTCAACHKKYRNE